MGVGGIITCTYHISAMEPGGRDYVNADKITKHTSKPTIHLSVFLLDRTLSNGLNAKPGAFWAMENVPAHETLIL